MSITGNLRTLEFSELLQWLAQGQKTGALVIVNGDLEKRVFFKEGRIISSESNNPDEHLGTFMVPEGLLDQETLARAVKLQESTQILLGKVLVTLGTISEEELTRVLQRKTEESLFELFNWTEGDFHFIPDDLPKLPMVPIEIDVTNIVLEGAKRFDEARRDGRIDTGDYGNQIEEMLSSEIFHGVDLDDDKSDEPLEVRVVPAEIATAGELVVDPELPPASAGEEPSETRAYYSGSGRRSGNRPMLAVAAAVAAIAIGVGAYFVMRPDPAGGMADRTGLEGAVAAEPMAVTEAFDPPPEPNSYLDEPVAEAQRPADDVAVPPTPDEKALQARYEAELEALKRKLAQAETAAAERDQAVDRIAELERQVEEAQEAATTPEPAPIAENRFASVPLFESANGAAVSAGGDEEPPLGSPLPATEADQEAGSDFAAEMVDPTAGAALPIVDVVEPPQAEAAVEEPAATVIDEPEVEPLISSPVLLSRPKPRYPAAAMRLRKEAEVSLRILIGTNGKVVDVERIGPDPGMGFSKAAINAALATQWRPATKDGEPIEMWTEMRIAFKP